jgi:hypothetical protein
MKTVKLIEVSEELLNSIIGESEAKLTSEGKSTNNQNSDNLVSQKELCKRLGITEATAINLKNKGIISPFGSLGRKVYYNWENVLAQMKKAHI